MVNILVKGSWELRRQTGEKEKGSKWRFMDVVNVNMQLVALTEADAKDRIGWNN